MKLSTREKILIKTLEIASQKGIAGVSLSQIAEGVGIKKATLYSHFSSKNEIIDNLYEYLREESMEKSNIMHLDYGKMVQDKTAEEVLKESVHNYMRINDDESMNNFYKFIISERVHNSKAAQIMVHETEKMLLVNKQLFYAMKIHNLISTADVDIVAKTFTMAIHSYINYNYDKIISEDSNIVHEIDNFIEGFCKLL